MMKAKKKIINDPLYGFVSIGSELVFEIIEHRYFQRLRHINQLGMACYVYPGARHSRFQHALGAYHLMGRALTGLRAKGIEISPEEEEAAKIAVLLHDVGHGPLSHSLEETLIPGIKHESLTYAFLKDLNLQFGGALDLAMKIFRNGYARKFFHELVNSQLDVDRLDYLKRDAYFTGVNEGTVGADRIIEMLNVKHGQVVVEEKGLFSIENFLSSRRHMYWQVYLHKTSVSAERLLVNIVRRAQYLEASGANLPCSPALKLFLKTSVGLENFREGSEYLIAYGQLDDHDIWGAIKMWVSHSDSVLALLCTMLLNRQLFKIKLSAEAISKAEAEQVKHKVGKHFGLLNKDSAYLFSHGTVSNEAYQAEGQTIKVLLKSGEIIDLTEASDLPGIKAMTKTLKKNFLCWPKNVVL